MNHTSSQDMETWYGMVRTPQDAIKLFEACRIGHKPRVQRRLSEKERQAIRSGSVFVWDEREAGMRRWTDGKSWSASRVSGSFLTYREMEGKRGNGFGSAKKANGKTPEPGHTTPEEQEDDGPEAYRYKPDGLMKQSFSITTASGQHLHLISYYCRPLPGQPDLPQPSTDPTLANIVPAKGMYPESSIGESNQTPALTRTPMQQAPYIMAQHPNTNGSYAVQPHTQAYNGAWPPSPMATPPFNYATTTYSHGPPAQPQHPHYQQAPHHPAAHYAPAPPYTDRALPNPQGHGRPMPGYPSSRDHSPPRSRGSSGSTELRGAPAAIMSDRSNGGSPGWTHTELPALKSVPKEQQRNGMSGVKLAGIKTENGMMHTPPSREHSLSPPQSSHSGSSPRSRYNSIHNLLDNGAGVTGKDLRNAEDARALSLLNRSFAARS